MSDCSSDEEFYDASDKIVSDETKSTFSHHHVQKRQINKRRSSFRNRLSIHSDHPNRSQTTLSAIKNNDPYHRAHNTSFEEYSSSTTTKIEHHSLSSSFKRHSRVHSWSGASLQTDSSLHRKSHESSRNSVLVGIHSYFQPPNSETPPHGKEYVKIKTKITTNKRFNRLVLAQTLAVDTSEVIESTMKSLKIKDEATESRKQPMGAIWTCQFSKDGKYMATAGQNCVVNVWKVLRDAGRNDNIDVQDMLPQDPSIKVFHDAPVRVYSGHTADVLDISWSKNNFLISGSMDKTVRLWHVSQNVCLCVFKHLDVVTSVKFHPKDDRFFLSGSFDCKVRLWSIPEKRVAFWNEIPTAHVVTAVGFTLDGRTACVGANTGDVFFFETQGLKYNTQILIKNMHNKHGKKVTGIEPMPGMPLGEERILVTTNDSRVWIINMKDKSFVYKYKGIDNSAMQIRASFSDDGRYIICGSEDGCVYLWCTDQVNYSPFQYLHDSSIKAAVALGHLGEQILQNAMQSGKFPDEQHFGGVSGWLKRGERRVIDKLRSRNEHFVAHQHTVTSAIFAPTKTRQMLAKSGGDIILDNTPVYTHRDHEEQESEETDDTVSTYEDAMSDSRKSRTSSLCTNDRRARRHQQQMNELHRYLMNRFEKASQEERDRYDYPDSQIIVSADLHGAIKVWRMDSGYYNKATATTDAVDEEEQVNDPKSSLNTKSNSVHSPLNTISEASSSKSIKSVKKKGFPGLFSKFK